MDDVAQARVGPVEGDVAAHRVGRRVDRPREKNCRGPAIGTDAVGR